MILDMLHIFNLISVQPRKKASCKYFIIFQIFIYKNMSMNLSKNRYLRALITIIEHKFICMALYAKEAARLDYQLLSESVSPLHLNSISQDQGLLPASWALPRRRDTEFGSRQLGST